MKAKNFGKKFGYDLMLIIIGIALCAMLVIPGLMKDDDIELKTAAIAGPPPAMPPGVPSDFKTIRIEVGETGHETFRGGGQFHSGTACSEPGCELCDANRYISSHKLGGYSEKIVVGGTVEYTKHEKLCGGIYTDKTYYTLEYWDGKEWILHKTSPEYPSTQATWGEGDWAREKTHIFYAEGAFNTYIRVKMYELWQICDWHLCTFKSCTAWTWSVVAIDYAYLAEGRAEIKIDNPNGQVEVDETLYITVDVGYATPFTQGHEGEKTYTIKPPLEDDVTVGIDGEGWSLFVYSYSQRDVVATFHPVDNKIQTFEYPVSVEDFTVTEDCKAINKLYIVLYNEINKGDWEEIGVIDDKGLGPTKPLIQFEKTYYEQGDLVKVSWSSNPNPKTKAKILHYDYDIKYISPTFPVDDGITSDLKTEFYVTEVGLLEVNVMSYDSACRPSPKGVAIIKIHEPTALGGFPILLILAIILAVISIILIWMSKRFGEGTKAITMKVVWTIVIIIIVIVLYITVLWSLEQSLFYGHTGTQGFIGGGIL